MICPNCHSMIPDDALFCPECGKPTGQYASQEQTAQFNAPQPNASSEYAAETRNETMSRKQHGSSRKAIMVIVLACALASGSVVGGAWYYHQQQVEQAQQQAQHQAEQERQQAAALDALRHQDHPVTFTIRADGYSPSDSPIPVRITGTDLDGNSVDTTCYVSQDGTGTTLKSGSYEASAVASPLTKSGALYAMPDSAISFEIPVSTDGGDSGNSLSSTAGGTIELTKLDPLDQSDDVINAAYQAAINGGFDSSTADTYRQAATKVRTNAQKAKEEADAKAAAQKKGQDAHAAYSTFLQGTYTWGNSTNVDLSTCRFAPIDVDGDGVDELLMNNPNASHVDCYERLFGYSGGKVVELAAERDGFKFFKSGAVLGVSIGTGSWDGTYYTLQNGAMTVVASYLTTDSRRMPTITDTFSDPGGAAAPYCNELQVNGADVDLDTYLATVRKLADQEVTPNLVDNTAQNRSKLLG